MVRDPLEIAASIIKLAQSGLFDRDWYVSTYGDAVADRGDPLVHYCNVGWLNGFNPSFYFDTSRYVAENDDVRQAALNPLVHYLDYGEAENRLPSEHFDAAWYRVKHGLAKDECCLGNYLRRRRTEPLAPNGGFDAAWYASEYREALDENPDLFEVYFRSGAQADRDPSPEAKVIRESGLFDFDYYLKTYAEVGARGLEPVYHYGGFGWRYEGCNPNPFFDTKWYLSINGDVQASGINPFYHYIKFGEPENRRPSESFNPDAYRKEHHLLPEESCLGHFLRHLSADTLKDPKRDSLATPAISAVAVRPELADIEAVERSELFDVNYYFINYPDVRESNLNPVEHFCSFGWREGRRANPYFDSAWYVKTYLPAEDAPNPLVHYIKFGEAAKHRPIVYFDPAWYWSKYDFDSHVSALQHFLENRRRQKYSPLQLFDIERYMRLYGAEIGPNRDPFAHFLRVGISQDIDPGPDFDAKTYRATMMGKTASRSRPVPGAEIHEKLRREALNPLVHFLLAQFNAAGAAAPETVRLALTL